ncbi:hypothetical protein CEXT_127851 [Caerostris extrusa]|uniref:Uncharacterized protein n=1 Tax=Caerostris extrusa TaxID=172846 RepID=A0AAV4SS76_CAEEX|nr:hypothetical protein CEXT_127851 [Caerostris extrusa]
MLLCLSELFFRLPKANSFLKNQEVILQETWSPRGKNAFLRNISFAACYFLVTWLFGFVALSSAGVQLRFRVSYLGAERGKVGGPTIRVNKYCGACSISGSQSEQFSERQRSRVTTNLEPKRQKHFSKKHFFRRLLFFTLHGSSDLGRRLIKVQTAAFSGKVGVVGGPSIRSIIPSIKKAATTNLVITLTLRSGNATRTAVLIYSYREPTDPPTLPPNATPGTLIRPWSSSEQRTRRTM